MGKGKPRARDGAWMGEPFPVLMPLDAAHASAELADMAARAGEAGLADLQQLLRGKSPAAAFIQSTKRWACVRNSCGVMGGVR